jgi:hypothetical protein
MKLHSPWFILAKGLPVSMDFHSFVGSKSVVLALCYSLLLRMGEAALGEEVPHKAWVRLVAVGSGTKLVHFGTGERAVVHNGASLQFNQNGFGILSQPDEGDRFVCDVLTTSLHEVPETKRLFIQSKAEGAAPAWRDQVETQNRFLVMGFAAPPESKPFVGLVPRSSNFLAQLRCLRFSCRGVNAIKFELYKQKCLGMFRLASLFIPFAKLVVGIVRMRFPHAICGTHPLGLCSGLFFLP